ncbi:MAG: trigger factor [Oscillospiraceae bacterium]|nr:trigger factor [Oscillospiraceae bacterium]
MGLLKCEKIEGSSNKYYLEISVSKDDFLKEIDKVYKKNVNKINVPGFRKGKAPKALIEKMYGNSVFWDDAINNLYPGAYMEASKEAKLDVVGTEKLDIISVDVDNGFVFKVECIVSPEVEIGEYKELSVTKNIRFVTDADVENEIQRIRQSYGRTVDITDRPAQMGDNVVIDFEGRIDSIAFDGGKSENSEIKLGDGKFIPGFEEQIVGHKIGEEFEINVKFPDDYSGKEFAGKDAVFNIILHEIKNIELPDLDDEFVKDISEFDSVEDFKEDIKKSIKNYKDKRSDEEVEDRLIDKLVDSLKAEIPQVMIDNKVESIKNDFAMNMKKQGVEFDVYLKYTGQKEEDLKKMFEPEAIRSVKLKLALEKIIEIENIETSPEEIEKTIKEMAESYKVKEDTIKNVFKEEDIIKDIKLKKAMDLVKETAKIEEVIETETKDRKTEEKK